MREKCRVEEILEAVVHNSGAPSDVLLRLLAEEATKVWPYLAWRGLPGDVVDGIVAHPAPRLRVLLAENVRIAAEQRARLAADPERKVRRTLAEGPTWFRIAAEPLPSWAQRRLLADPDEQVRWVAAQSRLTDDHLVAELADDPDPKLRRAACERWPVLGAEVQERLLADVDAQVRRAAAVQASRTRPEYTDVALADAEVDYKRSSVIRRAVLTRETAERLATGRAGDRIAVAANPSTPVDVARALARDESPDVRLAAACHPGLTEAERAAVDFEVKPDDQLEPVEWVLRATDPAELRACASSVHLALRRSAAYNEHLPPDAVEALAEDDDYIVRLLLCENQPTVPAEVVLQTYLDCPFITKEALLHHSNFPRIGNAARFADDPDSDKRYLALLDPAITPATLTALAGDTNRRVRFGAVMHPGLPADLLLECYAGEDTRLAALRNPSLPAEVLHRALDAVGIPR